MKKHVPWLAAAAIATAGGVPALGLANSERLVEATVGTGGLLGSGLRGSDAFREPFVVNAPGDLDATFSGDGKQTTDFGGSDAAADVVTQVDGKIVVAGSSGGDFALARYGDDGAVDPSFSSDGLVTTDFGGSDAGQGVAIQADGKIVVAGGSGGNFAVARYTAQGVLDTSFSGDGVQTTDFGADDGGMAVAIQADGRIVVAGGSGNNFALARYEAQGALDTSFSGDGRQTTDFSGFDFGKAVAIGADGKIVVAGASDTSEGGLPTADFALARYLDDGALDTTFSRDGRQTTDFGATYDTAEGVAVQADGGIVVAGHGSAVDTFGSYFPSDFELARYDAKGALDTSFSGDGRQTTNFGGDEFGYGVAVQSNGAIVAVGKAGGAFALARYNAAGSLDTGFSGDGMQTTDVTLLASNVVGVDGVLQADGKVVAVGATAGPGGITDFVLARYDGDTPDPNTPDALLSAGPTGPTNVTAPAFAFTATLPGSTFECKLDTPAGAGVYAECTSPQTYTTAANGAYTFSVRAVRSENTDAVPATRSFTVDTVPPVARILTGPPASSEPLLRLTFESNEPEGATFQCRLDQVEQPSSFYPCTSPHTLGPVPNGSEYYFLVLTTDAAGNTSQSVDATGLFSVGGTPDTTLTGGPILGLISDYTTEISGSFSFTSLKAGSTFECKRDGPDGVTRDYAPCVSPWPYGPLADGAYTFWVRATDPGGSVAPPATRSFTVDTVAPDTSITSGPSGVTSVRSASFEFDSTQPAYFNCKFDRPGTPGTYTGCHSGETTYSNLADGTYTFSVRSTDPAGNDDASPATRSFTVGTTPTPTATPSPTASPTPSPTASPTPSPTASPTPSPTASPTPSPTASPTPSPTPTPTTTPTPPPGTGTTTPIGSVPATLLLSLTPGGNLGAFLPGVAGEYETSVAASVTSSAESTALSVADPSATSIGRLTNGVFSLTQAIQARATNAANQNTAFAPVTGSANPLTLLTYNAAISADQVTIGLKQPILANEALRTGPYGKTLTFTLSTTTP
jgi:uncharacterized delta-60 repeat protein